ncbi:MAG: arsenate reductase ArsC [Ilumatobacteraceae bacterium]|nr:arsenate reductase ArsC [Ilumatobacteraceae bacterium]MDP5108417.1 arsenate reductase ArsC [Ilumatobacteraceae bacterium]
MSNSFGILFLCVHNAGRSQMAAALTRSMSSANVVVLSGGSAPAHSVNPMALAAMEEVGISLANEQPKKWTMEMLHEVDVVISMGCGDDCPILPGKERLDWEITDPAGQDLDFVRRVRDEIRVRVEAFLCERQLLAIQSN